MKDTQKKNSINKKYINEPVTNVTIKPESEIFKLNYEAENLQVMIKEMENDITSIMKNNITIDGEVKWYKIQEKFMYKKKN